MSQQELCVMIRPDHLMLEWTDATRRYPEASRLFQQELYRRYHEDPETWLLALAFADPALRLSPSLAFWRDLAAAFAQRLAQTPELETLREQAAVDLTDDDILERLASAPLVTGAEYLTADLLTTVWSALHHAYRQSIADYDGMVADWLHSYRPHLQLAGRVFFHLVENSQGDAPFAFLATYATRMGGDGESRHLPLKYALQEYGGDRDKLLDLLSAVYQAAKGSELLPQLLESGEIFHPLGWSPAEAFAFLREVPLYEGSGVLCRIPNWWTTRSVGAHVSVNIGTAAPAWVGMDAILNCAPSLIVDGVQVTRQEAEELLRQSEGLALIKNKWVAVDPDKLRQALDVYERLQEQLEEGELTLRDALALQLTPQKLAADAAGDVEVDVAYGEWLQAVIDKLRRPHLAPEVAPAKGFRATLRPYQQAGLNWLSFLDALGFGACLADDMGLGKTIQVLAFLSVKKQANATSLLIAPASLIANWSREIDTFYPDLHYLIAHPGHAGAAPRSGDDDPGDLAQYDLVITTYAMAQRYDALRAFHWDYLILDEAQAIKNPATKQTRAVKALEARNRIILTGTPVENRLSDLWSLFDFLNPGLLGSLTAFKTFSRSLQAHPGGLRPAAPGDWPLRAQTPQNRQKHHPRFTRQSGNEDLRPAEQKANRTLPWSAARHRDHARKLRGHATPRPGARLLAQIQTAVQSSGPIPG